MAEISRRNVLKAGLIAPAVISGMKVDDLYAKEENVSTVYMTKDLSPEGLKKIYSYINKDITGKVAVKLHTGEPHGPNIVPPAWVKEFLTVINNPTIVECNVLYSSPRQTTKGHLETLKTNGWTFAPVDIMDADGEVNLPVKNGKHFKNIAFGKNILNYDSMVVLTHFKGHAMGGFGGSLKNISIGCASGKTGKSQLHEGTWGATGEKFMENMVEGGKAVIDHFGKKIVYINVMRRMSVSCDCEGVNAAEPTVPDYGILASTDILAIDKACVDIVYNMKNNSGKDLIERIESRKGLRQLTYMKEMNMGNDKYKIVEI